MISDITATIGFFASFLLLLLILVVYRLGSYYFYKCTVLYMPPALPRIVWYGIGSSFSKKRGGNKMKEGGHSTIHRHRVSWLLTFGVVSPPFLLALSVLDAVSNNSSVWDTYEGSRLFCIDSMDGSWSKLKVRSTELEPPPRCIYLVSATETVSSVRHRYRYRYGPIIRNPATSEKRNHVLWNFRCKILRRQLCHNG